MNQIILSGNLGKDAEERSAEFWVTSLATTRKYTNKKTGEQVEQTDWHNLNLGGFFKNVIPYLKKGTKVLVTGEQRHTEKDGKYFHFVTVDKLELLGSKQDTENTPRTAQTKTQPAPTIATPPAEQENDDLPF